jgi:hypothetical protein
MDYAKTANSDHIEKCKDLMAQGALQIKDGKISPNLTPLWTSNWLFLADEEDKRKCNLYMDLIFPKYGFIHSDCHECWKVVARPKSLKDLMKVKDIQWELGYKGKCGIDTRMYTFGPYGAYWYNDSLEEGFKKLAVVREALKDIDVGVTLKRGCTEFEAHLPSTQWEITDEQKEIEADIENVYDFPNAMIPMPEYVKTQVIRRWVEKAHEIGDATCFEYSSAPLGVLSQCYERKE